MEDSLDMQVERLLRKSLEYVSSCSLLSREQRYCLFSRIAGARLLVEMHHCPSKAYCAYQKFIGAIEFAMAQRGISMKNLDNEFLKEYICNNLKLKKGYYKISD